MYKIVTCILIFLHLAVAAQDTVMVSKAPTYSLLQFPNYDKHFASIVKYGRTDIRYNPNHVKIEYTYFHDTLKFQKTYEYFIQGDSLLIINQGDSTYWKFRSLKDGNFAVKTSTAKYITTGKVSTLIPFQYTGLFYHQYKATGDTLYTTTYPEILYEKNYYYYTNNYYYTYCNEKIYSADQVTTLAQSGINGTLPDTLILERTGGYLSEPITYVRNIQFIVTSEGKIINVQQYFGNENFKIYPYYILELNEILISISPLIPATKNGKPVAMQYILPVKSGW
ncbi:MAG: hypothetical protein WAT43_01715 [Chitinophagales bacterium]